jgi:hypothetical protein
MESPEYAALTPSLPTANAEVVSVACPVPLRVVDPSVCVPLLKVMVVLSRSAMNVSASVSH